MSFSYPLTLPAAEVFAPTAGGSPRGASMAETRTWATEVERAVLSAAASGGALVFETLAQASATLGYPAHTAAWVVADPAPVNIGIYQKTGASGAGSWVKRMELASGIVPATVTGGPVAFTGTSALPFSSVDRAALLAWVMPAASGGSPVLTINGAALPLRDVAGRDLPAGFLPSGQSVIAMRVAGTLRCFVDAALISRALHVPANEIVPPIPAAAARASRLLGFDSSGDPVALATGAGLTSVPAANITDSTAAGRTLLTSTLHAQRVAMSVRLTRAEVAAADMSAAGGVIETSGFATAGDGGHGLYRRSAGMPAHPGRVQSTDGAWWELIEQLPTPAQFGAAGDNTADDAAALADADAYALARGVQLAIVRAHRIDANLTLSSPIAVGPAGRLNAATGRTLTIAAPIEASLLATIFQGAGTVTGAFGRHRVSPCWWGASPTKGNNASPGWQAAINVGRVAVPAGTFRFETQLACPAGGVDIECDWNGSVMIWAGPDQTALFRAFGQLVGSDITLAANAGRTVGNGRYADLTSSAGIQRGEFIYIRSEQVFDRNEVDGFGDNVKLGQIRKVEFVDGGRLRFETPLNYDFLTADNARVRRLDLVGPIRILGGRWFGADTDPATNVGMGDGIVQGGEIIDHSCFQLVGCFDPSIYIAEMSNFHGLGANFTDCVGGTFQADRCTNALGKIGYGVSINNASEGVFVVNTTFRRVRHSVAQGTNGAAGVSSLLGLYGITRMCGVRGGESFASDGFGDPINTHGACDDWIVDGHTIDGSVNYGVVARGASHTIKGVPITNATNGGMYIGSDVRPEYRRPSTVTGCSIKSTKPLPKALNLTSVVDFLQKGEEIRQGTARALVVTYSDASATTGLVYILETSGTFTTGSITTARSTGPQFTATVASVTAGSHATGMVLERLSAGSTISGNTIQMDQAGDRALQVNGCQNVLVNGNTLVAADGTQVVWESTVTVGASASNLNHYAANIFIRPGSGGAAMTGLGAGSTRAANTLRGYASET